MTDCGAIGLSEDTVNSLHGVLSACGAWGRDVTAGCASNPEAGRHPVYLGGKEHEGGVCGDGDAPVYQPGEWPMAVYALVRPGVEE